jgi:hypothetical protein
MSRAGLRPCSEVPQEAELELYTKLFEMRRAVRSGVAAQAHANARIR